MGIANFLFYVFNLIKEGHKWQYQNATCTNKPPKWYFTEVQWIAILVAITFVVFSPCGINVDVIDSLLSSLSILTGFYLALIVFVYDKYMTLNQPVETDEDKFNNFKNQNYLLQFNALSSYAILISIVVILILVANLLFGGTGENIYDYTIAPSIDKIDVLLTCKLLGVIFVRLSLVYFIFNFFIISLYAVCSLFQFVNIGMREQRYMCEIDKKKVEQDDKMMKKKYPWLFSFVKFLLILFCVILIVCIILKVLRIF